MEVWLRCQENDAVLLTNNRNRDGIDSLESVLRSLNDGDKLPVITIGDVQRFGSDRSYALRASRKALDYFFLIEDFRGAGRLYIP